MDCSWGFGNSGCRGLFVESTRVGQETWSSIQSKLRKVPCSGVMTVFKVDLPLL